MRAIVADERYGAMKTNSEKKACLAEYQAEKLKQAREEKRELMKRLREQFTELLREKGDQIESKTKFADAVRLFGVDPRWRALTERRDQEELFYDYLKEVERVEREQARLERKASRWCILCPS